MSNIKIFEDKNVRSHYDAEKEIWFFSIVDIVGILTVQPTIARARNYWKVLKSRLLSIAPVSLKPGRFDIRLRRSDLRYFLLNSEDSQKATAWLCKILNAHPLERPALLRKTYNEISIQMFGCYILTLSLITNTGFSYWKEWIELCDPNISMWITEDSAVEAMEKMISVFC